MRYFNLEDVFEKVVITYLIVVYLFATLFVLGGFGYGVGYLAGWWGR